MAGKSRIKKILLPAVSVIILIPLIILAVNFNKIRTIASISKAGKGLYTMSCYTDIKTDKLLNANISTLDDLISWIIDEQVGPLPLKANRENFGCATFSCKTPEGETLFGRNFDYAETDTAVIYTDPDNGYASYSLADLKVMDLGAGKIDPESAKGRAYMLAAPYMCVDGLNEAGLAIGILELETAEIHLDNGKPDLLIFCAIRAILDKCATVDEATELLNRYDIHSGLDSSYHLHIVDKQGNSAVVEWLDNQMQISKINAATNSVLTPGKHFLEGSPDIRITTLNRTLEKNKGTLTEDKARDLLKAVSQRNYTEWSCVYNTKQFKVDIYMDEDYKTPYSFGGQK